MYSDIKIVKGNGGYGGPLIIRPTKVKHKFIYVTGGGERPMIVDKIEELTGKSYRAASGHERKPLSACRGRLAYRRVTAAGGCPARDSRSPGRRPCRIGRPPAPAAPPRRWC